MIRVMIVEDEPSSAERYASYITDFGHGFVVCSICHQAAQALEEFAACRPEVVFSDIRMPGQSGLAMIEKLRGSGWSGHAVIISGYDDFTYAQRAIHLQALEYMLKPVFPEDMNRTLTLLLSKFGEGPADSVESMLIGAGRRPLPRFIQRAVRYISLNYTRRICLAEAAKFAFVSPAYLSSVFKNTCGYTFVEYIRRYRIEVAKRLLPSNDIPLEEIAARVGITDAAYFNKLFKRVEQTTPGRYRRLVRKSLASRTE